ncbi:branched-chain amino acid ABC transporter permease [Niallia sp. Krafla_26]|uniref:branched-chain amino acid ABC transporter permease n=1 Tax=Niallia sp. Krafla_26 TaxID=3064703 RepID=UPI003D16F6EE
MLAQLIVNGLIIGSVYSLIALGYTMVYGILRIVNFAHGDVMMFGSFLGLVFMKTFQMHFLVAFTLAAVCTAILGIVIERFAYRPLRKYERIASLISAMGVSIILANLAQLIWGSGTHNYGTPFSIKTYEVMNITISNLQLIILGTSFVLMIALYLFTNKTRMGVAMRATAQSIENASLMGININSVIAMTFGIGSVLAALAGILVSMYYDAVYPTMGYMFGLKAFTAAVLGGIGSIPGAMIGGLLLGVVENLGGTYISTQYQDMIAFVILILVLVLRPTGILGKKDIKKV